MSLTSILKSFIWPSPLKNGQKAPRISLTSQDGAWIKSEDYHERWNMILLFVHSLDDTTTVEWIKEYDRTYDTILESKIFIVTNIGTKSLREFQDNNDIHIDLLYDPLSIEARRMGMSHRRPMTKNGIVYISKEQKVLYATHTQTSAQELIQTLGLDVRKESTDEEAIPFIETEETMKKLKAGYILIDVRTQSEYDAHHVPGSKHIPIDDLSAKLESLSQQDKLIFICQAGGRAYSAAELMRSIGAQDIFVVEGGMSQWSGPQRNRIR